MNEPNFDLALVLVVFILSCLAPDVMDEFFAAVKEGTIAKEAEHEG